MSQEVVLPELAESVVEGEIVRWLVAVGERVEADQPLVEVMTDKVTVLLPSPFAGTISAQLAQVGDVVAVHQAIARLDEISTETSVEIGAEAPSSPEPSTQAREERSIVEAGGGAEEDDSTLTLFRASLPANRACAGEARAATNRHGRVLAVPAARALAKRLELDLTQIAGSGAGGRVSKQDVARHANRPSPSQAPSPTPNPASGPEVRTPARTEMAAQMMHSHLSTVRTLTVDEADVTELMALVKRLAPATHTQGVAQSHLPFFVKAVVRTLNDFPALNSSLDEAKQEVVHRSYVHLGITLAHGQALTHRVLEDAGRMSLIEIVHMLATPPDPVPKSGEVAPTFSIVVPPSGLFSFPIIPLPAAAVLALHPPSRRPIVAEDRVVARTMSHLALSFDHRLVDGAEAARFCAALVRRVSDPDVWSLELT